MDVPYVAQRPELFIGTTTGNGECVALVQRAGHAPPTSFWRRGVRVKGNTEIKPGTVIATFDPIRRYGNHKDHTSHAAIYIGQTPDGIEVIDQWNDNKNHKPWHHHAGQRTLRFGAHGHPVNNGDNFYVVD